MLFDSKVLPETNEAERVGRLTDKKRLQARRRGNSSVVVLRC